MPKNTEEKENLKEKLSYLGLNLERIPKILKEFTPFSFKPANSYDETSYKVYQYIPVCDIQILLTPSNRLTNLNQKYKLAAPISAYLDSREEKNIERFSSFLNMLNNMDIEKIEEIEKEQEKLKQNLPYEIKYANNYIWQIYYSDISKQYFMLVPTEETNNNAFFYLLRKQIECSKSRKKEYIFAPVTHQEYSGQYLVKSQITDIENYLWYFTKEWPNIYEVYDAKGKMNIKIVGNTKVYEDIRSDYVITLENKEKALEWYKLIKALFILATGLSEDYTFQTAISEDGSLEFWNEEKTKLEYKTLPVFIKEQVDNKKILVDLEDKKIEEEQIKLQDLKEETQRQTEEFLNKQRQIATFLACKKSFFGKVKYYFGNRKKHLGSIESFRAKTKIEKEDKETVLEEKSPEETKENYTIEDLIEVCTKLNGRMKIVKNLEVDRKAQELKKINLDRKIKNANIYLNEIELHKKSIFEFWKFANKDELPSLNEGEEDESGAKDRIGKSFVYDEDIESLGKQMDELQRRKLSKNETDSIFAVKHALASCRILQKAKSSELTKTSMKKLQEELNNLKNEYEANFETIQVKDFDIFGGMVEDHTKVKMLHNKKHREVEKDKYKVLNITPNTELETYIDNLRNSLNLVKEAFCKVSTPFEMPIYIAGEELNEDNLNIGNLNATEEIYNAVCHKITKETENDKKTTTKTKSSKKTTTKESNEDATEENIRFYTIKLPENSPLLYYTNIMQFDNFNQTLPAGMDGTKEVLINLENYKLEGKQEKEFRINYQLDEYTNKVVTIQGIAYQAKSLNMGGSFNNIKEAVIWK